MKTSSRFHPCTARSTSSLFRVALVGVVVALVPVLARAEGGSTPSRSSTAANPPDWVARSNENAQVLLKVFARFSPEGAGQLGIEGLDEQVMDLNVSLYARSRKAMVAVVEELQKRLAKETDPAVRQDLELTIAATQQRIKGSDLSHNYEIPYYNIVEAVFHGVRALLDDQVEAARRPAALVRLRRYAGMEKGYKPITELAHNRTVEKLRFHGLIGPPKREVEKDLDNAPRFLAGIDSLFQKYEIDGYKPVFEKLKQQFAEYEAFVRSDVLPRTRTSFRLPSELYSFRLEQSGIDMPVDELTSRARVAFGEIREQMQALAPLVAKQHGFTVTDYRDVIRALKKKQIVGDAILDHYKHRIQDVEEIIRREHIVTLPVRPVRIRLASEAESAAVPAPHMRPPRMLGNRGEMGEFVLPLKVPVAPGEDAMAFDDFTFDAASWTLTAHEARPGHDLQFASMVEGGVSIARAMFAMNSVNVEGWALYAEWEMKPYLPLDGQLISLQHRLLRAARAFLDPGVQLGTIAPEEAKRVLKRDVVLSEPMATQEIERYMFWAPGQAPSYFCGYTRLLDLRTETQLILEDGFDRMAFNDFVLAQGVLPPRLIRKAVMEEFVPAHQSPGKTD